MNVDGSRAAGLLNLSVPFYHSMLPIFLLLHPILHLGED